MLVLTRKHGERILIGENIEVVVLKVNGNRVRLGIVGPQEVPIHREELRRRIDPPTGGRQTDPRWCGCGQ